MSARYGRKLDENHRTLVALLKALGARVATIQGEAGTPDLVVRVGNLERLCEVKPEGERLNANQVEWWRRWGCEPLVLRSNLDCIELVKSMREETR